VWSRCPSFVVGRAEQLGYNVRYADVAQLVERDLAKVEVAGSSPVVRSNVSRPQVGPIFGYLPKFVVFVHQLDGFTNRVRVGTTVQKFLTFNCRFIQSFFLYGWRLREKCINRIGTRCFRCDIVFLVASHKIDCTVTNVESLKESSTLFAVTTREW